MTDAKRVDALETELSVTQAENAAHRVRIKKLEEALKGCMAWIEAITDGVEANYPEVYWQADHALAGKGGDRG